MLPDVIIANLNHFFTGVTATLENLYRIQAREVSIGIHGYNLSFPTRKVGFWQLLRYGRVPPKGKPFRIFHARRAIDLRRGLFLRDYCGVKIKVIFSSVKQRAHSFPLRRMIERADGVIAITKEVAAIRPKVLATIPHGVDLKKFSPKPRENWHYYAAQRRLSSGVYSSDKQVCAIGQVGNIRRSKGSHIFVRALCSILPEYPHAIGVIAGRWLLKDALLVYRLKRMLKKAGLAERVLWLGLASYDDMPSLMRALDVYVSVSLEEGFGMATIEALASGTPIVVTPLGCASLAIRSNRQDKVGRIVPIDDHIALAKAMRQLLLRGKNKEIIAACRARALELFAIEREAREIVKVYKKMWKGECMGECTIQTNTENFIRST